MEENIKEDINKNYDKKKVKSNIEIVVSKRKLNQIIIINLKKEKLLKLSNLFHLVMKTFIILIYYLNQIFINLKKIWNFQL